MIRKVLSSSLLLSLLITFPLCAIETLQDVDILSFSDIEKIDMSEATLEFSPELVSTHGIEEDINLLYDKDGFYVRTKENDVRVKAYDTDKLLRSSKVNDIAKYATLGKFKVSKFDNGEYAVHAQGGLKGGGVAGATGGAIFGKFIVHFIGHGAIQIVALCSGPAYFVTVASLEAALLPTVIEPLSNAAAIGCGILGGVATGPI